MKLGKQLRYFRTFAKPFGTFCLFVTFSSDSTTELCPALSQGKGFIDKLNHDITGYFLFKEMKGPHRSVSFRKTSHEILLQGNKKKVNGMEIKTGIQTDDIITNLSF